MTSKPQFFLLGERFSAVRLIFSSRPAGQGIAFQNLGRGLKGYAFWLQWILPDCEQIASGEAFWKNVSSVEMGWRIRVRTMPRCTTSNEILIIAMSTILSGGQSAVERGPVRRLRALPGHPEFCDRKRIAQEQFLRVPRGPRLMANCACRAGSQNEHACPARPACLRRIGGPSNNWDVQIVGLQSGIIEKAP